MRLILKYWKITLSLLTVVVLFFVVLVAGIGAQINNTITIIGGGNQQESGGNNLAGGTYVKHWLPVSGGSDDAYHSDFLAQRYGITEEQIDSFIRSQGFKPEGRASGSAFLSAQAQSGIDVRVLVAMAQWESSYGTAGVAAQYPLANIWGYGCFDNDPNMGANWGPERAFRDFRNTQIERYGNRSMSILDDRAINHSGPVYWSDTSSTGKRRAQTMQDLDTWIDKHGGTPAPPSGYGPMPGTGGGNGSLVGNGKGDIAMLDGQLGKFIGTGQCYALTSWYVNQVTKGQYSLGAGIGGGMPPLVSGDTMNAYAIGSAYNWGAIGWAADTSPEYSEIKTGDVINFRGEPYDATFGHTGVVGKVLGGNKFVLYNQNPTPVVAQTATWGNVTSIVHPPANK